MKVELAHDNLAKIIYNAASFEHKQQKHAHAIIDMKYTDYQLDPECLLDEGEIQFIKDCIEQLGLSEAKQAFYQASCAYWSNLYRRKKTRNYLIITIAACIIFLPLAIWGLYQAGLASSHAETAREIAMRKEMELNKVNQKVDSLQRAADTNQDPQIMSYNELEENDFSDIRPNNQIYATVEIKGQIQDQQNRPVANATIVLMGAKTQTDARGRFSCYFIMPPLIRAKGSFPIRVEKRGFQPLKESVEINDLIQLNLVLQPIE